MPFIESAFSAQARANATQVPKPVVAVIVVLAVAVVALGASNISAIGASDKLVVSNEAEPQSVGDAASDDSADAAGQPTEGDAQAAAAEQAQTEVVVYVSGAVAAPGVYRFGADARVDDAVAAAGGMLPEAQQGAVNLARPLQDGEQIAVPYLGEAAPVQEQPAAPVDAAAAQPGLVNINTASAAELETLPGVGPATAEKIVASREAEGPFASVEDIKRVSGIGDKKYEALADLVTV